MLPLQTAPFSVFEPALHPGAQAVPADIGLLGREGGDNQPRLGMASCPACEQGTSQGVFLKADDLAAPMATCLGRGRRKKAELMRIARTELAGHVDAQEGVLAHWGHVQVQPMGVQAAVSQDYHCPVSWYAVSQMLETGPTSALSMLLVDWQAEPLKQRGWRSRDRPR